ncbi:hypothetical protein K5X82_03675 [Halosquirtibacter xylanolyticus]|uniref:beta-propeller domain-containing protein n=1 Tax=Halosquirtibacter xylanolyticus TaxID=3374599 RepID=UPI00374984A0|nr:hypothetical protein K5X82_03675 [Prolixibacteraceae bacterium]
MRKIFEGIVILFIAIGTIRAQSKTIVMAGSGNRKIIKATRRGKILWTYELEKGHECNCVSELDNGNILYSYKKGAAEITKDYQVVWNYKAPIGTEVQSISLTNEENYLVGQCGSPMKVLEINKKGKVIFEMSFDTKLRNPHAQLRRVRKTEKGTYIVPVRKKRTVYEFNKEGAIINEVYVGGVPFATVVLKNNNWLVSCGDGHRLIEINPLTKQIVWEVKENDIEGISLRSVTEAIRLKNGNTIICNWGGHAKSLEHQVQVVEIDKHKKVVWKLHDKKKFGQISSLDPSWDKDKIR